MMQNLQKFPHLRRWISLVTLGLYVLTQGVCPPGYAAVHPEAGLSVHVIESALKTLPKSMGHVSDFFTSSHRRHPFILIIQDAHGQIEAQKNTHRLLAYLDEKIPLRQFFIEGGVGRLDPENLRLFEEPSMNQAAAEWFLNEGDLGGAELFLLQKAGVTHKGKKTEPFSAWGAEDRELYLDNLDLFEKVAGQSPLVEERLTRERLVLEKRASTSMNPDLLRFFKIWMGYEQAVSQLESYLAALESAALKHANIKLSDARNQQTWPMLVRYSELKRRQARLHVEKVAEETARLLEWARAKNLERSLPALEINENRARSVGKTSADLRDQWESFYRRASPLGFKFEDYPALTLWEGARVLESELDAKQLMDEADNLRDRVLESLVSGPAEQEIILAYRDYLQRRKLLKLQLERSDFEKLLNQQQAAALAGAAAEGAEMRSAREAALRFYQRAIDRERRMSELLLESGGKQDVVVSVSGGFHTAAITRKLREAGFSYAVLSPHMSHVEDESRYWNSMISSRPLYAAPALKDAGSQAVLSANHIRAANLLAEWQGLLPPVIRFRRERMFEGLYQAGRRSGAAVTGKLESFSKVRSEVRTQAGLPGRVTLLLESNETAEDRLAAFAAAAETGPIVLRVVPENKKQQKELTDLDFEAVAALPEWRQNLLRSFQDGQVESVTQNGFGLSVVFKEPAVITESGAVSDVHLYFTGGKLFSSMSNGFQQFVNDPGKRTDPNLLQSFRAGLNAMENNVYGLPDAGRLDVIADLFSLPREKLLDERAYAEALEVHAAELLVQEAAQASSRQTEEKPGDETIGQKLSPAELVTEVDEKEASEPPAVRRAEPAWTAEEAARADRQVKETLKKTAADFFSLSKTSQQIPEAVIKPAGVLLAGRVNRIYFEPFGATSRKTSARQSQGSGPAIDASDTVIPLYFSHTGHLSLEQLRDLLHEQMVSGDQRLSGERLLGTVDPSGLLRVFKLKDMGQAGSPKDSRGFFEKMKTRTFIQAVQDKIFGGEFNIVKSTIQNAGLRKKQAHQWSVWLEQVTAEFSGESLSAGVMAVLRKHFSVQIRRFEAMGFDDPGSQDAAIAQIRSLAGSNPNAMRSYERSVSKTYNAKSKKFNADLDAMDNSFRPMVNQAALFASELLASVIQEEFLERVQFGELSTDVSALQPQAVQASAADSQEQGVLTLAPEMLETAAAERLQQMKRETVQKKGQWAEQDDEAFRQFFLEWAKHEFAEKGKMPNFPATRNAWQALKKKEMNERAEQERAQTERANARAAIENFIWETVAEKQQQENSRWQKLGEETGVRDYARTVWISETMVDQYLTSPETARSYPDPKEFRKAMTAYRMEHSPQARLEFQVDEVLEKLQETGAGDLAAMEELLTRVGELLSQPLVKSQRQALESQSRELLNRAIEQTRQSAASVIQRITVPKEAIAASERDELRERLRVILQMVRQKGEDVLISQLEAEQLRLELFFELSDEIKRLSVFAKSGEDMSSDTVRTLWDHGASLRGKLKAAGEAAGLQILDETLSTVAEAYAVARVTASQAAAEGDDAAELGKLIEAKTMLTRQDGQRFAAAVKLLDEEISAIQQKLKNRMAAEERTKRQQEIDQSVARQREIDTLLKNAQADAATAASLLAAPELKAELTDRLLLVWLTALSEEKPGTPGELPKTGKVISYLTSALKKPDTAGLKRQLFTALLTMAKARSEMRTDHEELEEDLEIPRLRTVEMVGVSTQIPRGLFVREGEQDGFIPEQTLPLGLEEYTLERPGSMEAYRIAGEVEVKGDVLPVYAMDYFASPAWQELAAMPDPEHTPVEITVTGLAFNKTEAGGQKRVGGFYASYKGLAGFIPFAAKPGHLNFGTADVEKARALIGQTFPAFLKNFGRDGDDPVFYISKPPKKEDIQTIENAAPGTPFEVRITGAVYPNNDKDYEPSGFSAEWNGVYVFIPHHMAPWDWRKDFSAQIGRLVRVYTHDARDRVFSLIPPESEGVPQERIFPYLRAAQTEMLHVKWLTHKRRQDGSYEITGLRVIWGSGGYAGYVPLDQIPVSLTSELSEKNLKALVGKDFIGNFLRIMGSRPGFRLEAPPSATVAMVRLQSSLMIKAATAFTREELSKRNAQFTGTLEGESFAVLNRRVVEAIDVLEKTGKLSFLKSMLRNFSKVNAQTRSPEFFKVLADYQNRISLAVEVLSYDTAFLDNLRAEEPLEMTVGDPRTLNLSLGGKRVSVDILAARLLPEASGDVKLDLAFHTASPLLIHPRKKWISGEKKFVLDSGQVYEASLRDEIDRARTAAGGYQTSLRVYAGLKIIIHEVSSGDEIEISVGAIHPNGRVILGFNQKDFNARQAHFETSRSEVRASQRTAGMKDRTLHVAVQPDMGYEVKMSDRIFDRDNPLLQKEIKGRKVLVVADLNIGQGKLSALRDYLTSHGVSFEMMTLPGGEQVKDGEEGLENVIKILKAAEDAGLSRKDLMILVGGGALLDVGGFAASIAHRGIPHVRIPTTLLAQVDAGIGVKNSINFFGQKNFVGAFRPPQSVLVDPDFLHALDPRQVRSGMAEAIKVSLMKDADYFRLIEDHGADLLRLDFSAQSRARDIMWLSIVRHLEQIHTDPFETKLARPLDYGHEWGHRLEAVTNHTITHGEGVAIGTAIDTVISWQRGYISRKQLDRVLKVIEQSGLPIYHKDATVENLWPGLESFRRHLGGKLTISLLGQIGRKRDTHRMEMRELVAALDFLSRVPSSVSRSEVRAKSGHEKRKQQSKIRAQKEAAESQAEKRRLGGLVIAVSMGGGLLFDMFVLGMSPLDPEIPLTQFFITYFLTASSIALAALLPLSLPFWVAQWKNARDQWAQQMNRRAERAERHRQRAEERQRQQAAKAELQETDSKAERPEPSRSEAVPAVETRKTESLKTPLEKAVSRVRETVRSRLYSYAAAARRKETARNAAAVIAEFEQKTEELLNLAASEYSLGSDAREELRRQTEKDFVSIRQRMNRRLDELKEKEKQIYTAKRDKETRKILEVLPAFSEAALTLSRTLMADNPDRAFPLQEALGVFEDKVKQEKQRLADRLKLTAEDAEALDANIERLRQVLLLALENEKQQVEQVQEAKRLAEAAAAKAILDFETAKASLVDYLWNRIVQGHNEAKFGSEAEVREFAFSWIPDEMVVLKLAGTDFLKPPHRFIDFQKAWGEHAKTKDPRYVLEQKIKDRLTGLEAALERAEEDFFSAVRVSMRLYQEETALEPSQKGRLRAAVEKAVTSRLEALRRRFEELQKQALPLASGWTTEQLSFETLLSEPALNVLENLEVFKRKLALLQRQAEDHDRALLTAQEVQSLLASLADTPLEKPQAVLGALQESEAFISRQVLTAEQNTQIYEARNSLFDRWKQAGLLRIREALTAMEQDAQDLDPRLDLALGKQIITLEEFEERSRDLAEAVSDLETVLQIHEWLEALEGFTAVVAAEDIDTVKQVMQESEAFLTGPEIWVERVLEGRKALASAFAAKAAEGILETEEGGEKEAADRLRDQIQWMGAYFYEETRQILKEAYEAEEMLRQMVRERDKKRKQAEQEERQLKATILKGWIERPEPLAEAAQFFLNETSFDEFLKKNRVVQKFLEQVSRGESPDNLSKVQTYLGLDHEGKKIAGSSPSDKVMGEERHLIIALGRMVAALTSDSSAKSEVRLTPAEETARLSLPPAIDASAGKPARAEVRQRKMTLADLRNIVQELEGLNALDVGELQGEFSVSPKGVGHLQNIDARLAAVEASVRAAYPDYRIVTIDDRRTGDRDDVRLEIKPNLPIRSEIRDNLFYEQLRALATDDEGHLYAVVAPALMEAYQEAAVSEFPKPSLEILPLRLMASDDERLESMKIIPLVKPSRSEMRTLDAAAQEIYQEVQDIVRNFRENFLPLDQAFKRVDQDAKWLTGHFERVSQISIVLGLRLWKDMPEEQRKKKVLELGVSAYLHDTGKALWDSNFINNSLNFPSSEEMEDKGQEASARWKSWRAAITAHPKDGYDLVNQMGSFLFEARGISKDAVLSGILEHHENQDGTGYPRKLNAAQISEFGRIIHLVDSFDAAKAKRAYSDAMAVPEVFDFLKKKAGVFYDQKYVELFTSNFFRKILEQFYHPTHPWDFDSGVFMGTLNGEDENQPRALIDDLAARFPRTPKHNLVVLDLGSFKGTGSEWILQQGVSVLGLEKETNHLLAALLSSWRQQHMVLDSNFSPAQAVTAMSSGTAPSIAYSLQDITKGIPIPDESVNGIVLHRVLSTMLDEADIRRLLKEIARVLKPGGQISVMDYVRREDLDDASVSWYQKRYETNKDAIRILRAYGYWDDVDAGFWNLLDNDLVSPLLVIRTKEGVKKDEAEMTGQQIADEVIRGNFQVQFISIHTAKDLFLRWIQEAGLSLDSSEAVSISYAQDKEVRLIRLLAHKEGARSEVRSVGGLVAGAALMAAGVAAARFGLKKWQEKRERDILKNYPQTAEKLRAKIFEDLRQSPAYRSHDFLNIQWTKIPRDQLEMLEKFFSAQRPFRLSFAYDPRGAIALFNQPGFHDALKKERDFFGAFDFHERFKTSVSLSIQTDQTARAEVRSLPDDWASLTAGDLFSEDELTVFDWRMSYLDGLWPRWDDLAKEMLLTPSFLLMLLGAKPGYISTTTEESLPAKFFDVANQRFRNDLGYGLFNDDLQSPIAFSLKESIQSVYENEVYFREQGLPLSNEDILGLAVLSKHPYWNWQDEHILFARKILSDLFADAVKQDRTWDIFMGLIAGYPSEDVKEYVRLNGRELGHEGVLENFMDYRQTEFANVFFLSRKEGSPEADRQKARFRAALYYAYAGLRHHADFKAIASRINLPESVHTAPAPFSAARSEIRRDAGVIAVAKLMTSRIVRISDLRPEILEKLFPLALRQPEAKLPEPEREWGLRFYTALFKQGGTIILPASLLRQLSSEAQQDYLGLLIEALQSAESNPREPLIHVAGDQDGQLKNLFFSPENWRRKTAAGVGASRAVKFWREPEVFVAERLEKQKTRYAAAVTDQTALKTRAFFVKPAEIRKLTRVQRVIFQTRLTQLLQAASALNEEEFAQLARELGLNYQMGEAIALSPSAILSSVFTERMNAVLIAKSA